MTTAKDRHAQEVASKTNLVVIDATKVDNSGTHYGPQSLQVHLLCCPMRQQRRLVVIDNKGATQRRVNKHNCLLGSIVNKGE